VSPLDAHADRLSRTLLAAGLLVERCGRVVVAMSRRGVDQQASPRVSLWPAAGCVLLTLAWAAWVAWLVGGRG
jgi:hypothetical protein